MGGLSKKSHQLKTIVKNLQKPAVILDAGNLLFKQTVVSASQDLLAASGIMDIYRDMAYDAVAVGPHDIAAGPEFLQDAAKKGFPWLSANIVDSNRKPLFKPAISIKRAGLTIGIIGLTDPTISIPAGITITDWRQALAEQLSALGQSADLLVVLSNLTEPENAELASKYPQVHILLSANRHQGNIQPRIINHTLVTQTHSQGKHLGMLDLKWQPGGVWEKDFSQESLFLHDRLSILDRKILRIERQESQPGRIKERLLQLRQERQAVLDEIDALTRQLERRKAEKQTFNSFQHAFIPMNKNSPDDQEILKKVWRIKDRINSHNQETSTGRQPQDQTQSTAGEPSSPPLTGFLRCAECHTTQTKFWKTTKHDRAYWSLLQQKQNFNLSCLPCHVTLSTDPDAEGSVKQGNLLNLPQVLRGVGCESCHGPGYAHAASPTQVTAKKEVSEAVCLGCHTGEHSPGFAYELKIAKVSCPAD